MQAVQVGEEGLKSNDPVHAAELAPLWDIVLHVEGQREEAIDPNSGPGAVEKDPAPEDMAGRLKPHSEFHADQKGTENPVIGLADVRELEPCWKAQLLKASLETQMSSDIITDVAAEDIC